jgi:hypothetical protein
VQSRRTEHRKLSKDPLFVRANAPPGTMRCACPLRCVWRGETRCAMLRPGFSLTIMDAQERFTFSRSALVSSVPMQARQVYIAAFVMCILCA